MDTCDNYNFRDVTHVTPDYIRNRFTVLNVIRHNYKVFAARVVDNETNAVVFLKAMPLGGIYHYNKMEVTRGCSMKTLLPYTDCVLVPLDAAVTDIGTYFDPDELSLPNVELSELVFTTPLIERYFHDNNISRLFEILYTLVIFKQHKLVHGDLHDENIMNRKTDYDRIYNINGINFVITNPYMPVFIDYNTTANARSDQDYYRDWKHFSNKVPIEYRKRIQDSDVTILLSELFQELQQVEVEPGSTVKMFAPITI